MNKLNPANILDVQVDSSHYTTTDYCLPGRFAAYAYQIKEILDSGAKKVLEIGPGNGVVTYTLRKAGIHVDTLDHDPALKPDYVASVLDLPFAQNSYDAVICCQVLEHLPWENFRNAIQGMFVVARNTIVISLPHASRRFYIEFKLPMIKKRIWSIEIPINPMKKTPMPLKPLNGEHYWEIGRGKSERDLLSIFEELGLRVDNSYRVTEYWYHHMFCLSK